MANATPAASCPSCSYTPLAIATSTFSFLTFLYALTVGLIYYYGLAKSSPEETDKFIEAVFKTLTELNEAVHQMTDEEPAAQQVEEEITRKMTKDIHALGAKVIEQRDSLYGFRGRFGSLDESQGFIITSSPGGQGITKAYFVSKPGSWLPGSRSLISSRIRYLITRKELQRKVEETDRLMTEIRFLQQRHLKLRSDRIAKATREEQREMLENILSRISSLEASGSTSRQSETTNRDPPPESTD